MKNILLVNSSNFNDSEFVNIFEDLLGKDLFFILFSSKTVENIGDKVRFGKKIFLGFQISNVFSLLFFLSMLPILWVFYFGKMFFLKKKEKIGTVICLGDRERIIFSPICSLLKLRNVWLELPENDQSKRPLFLKTLLKFFSKKIKILVFTGYGKECLVAFGFKENNIENISLGARMDNYEHQDDIFSNLAKIGNAPLHIRHFTIGLAADLNYRNQIENLFRALSICVNMIPNLQVIVIGEGEEKKRLNWLAKKMNLDKIIWFVGQQESLNKWLKGFDLYVAVSEKPKLFDLNIILQAMFSALPVIGFRHKDLEELVIEGQTGFLITPGDADSLAQKIISLEQDRSLKDRLSIAAKELAKNHFTRQKQLDLIKTVIDKL